MNSNITNYDPDRHLGEIEECEQKHKDHHIDEKDMFEFEEEDDNLSNNGNKDTPLDVDKFQTPAEIVNSRGRLLKFGVPAVIVACLVILTITSFFEVRSNNHGEEIRRASKAAELPQDLNITSDPVIKSMAVDEKLDDLDQRLGSLNTGFLANQYASEANTSKGQKADPQLSPDELAKLILEKIRKEMKADGSYPQAKRNNLPLPPSLVVNQKMPKMIQKIAKNSGDSSSLEVGDFLTVPTGTRPPVPQTIQAAQNDGAQLLPPSNNVVNNSSSTTAIPPLSNNQGNISYSRNQVKVTDAPTLKTNYITAKTAAEEAKAKKPYQLMMGLAKATLHTGFRAPTLEVGEKNMQPVLMSVDSSVIAANDTLMDIQECTVLGTSKGNLNSERAEIRLAELNCVVQYKNGKKGKITEPINGWVYGEDGIFGLKGRLVSGEGKILKAALPITLIQSLIGALSQSQGLAQVTVPGLGASGLAATTSSGTDLLTQGAATGFGRGANQALNQVVSYYMSMLKELNPSIEILGGRNNLTILFKGGEKLKEEEFEPANINKGVGR